MKITFWGVRGSIASPGPSTVQYGGNTTCIQVETPGGIQIILDAGTGIRALGNHLVQSGKTDLTILISHTHWDHIQGLPFFVPLFMKGNKVGLYGTFDPVYQQDLKAILARQLEYCYFPVSELELKADIHYHSLREGDSVEIGDARVQCVMMNHPVLTYGYRIDCAGKSLFFSGDHEHPYNIYEPGEFGYEEFEEMLQAKTRGIIKMARDVDAFIIDTMYTEAEIHTKRGWGHGTFTSGLAMGRSAAAKHILFTHHDPMRTDAQLDSIYQDLLEKKRPDDPKLTIAREGLTVEL